MKKSRGFITLLITLIVIAGLGYVAYFGVGKNGGGSAKNIKQGLDLAGGVSITYQVVGDETPSIEDMKDTIYKLQKRVDKYSTEAQVYQEGTNRINIEIPGVSDANAILTELGRPGSLYFIAATNSAGEPNYGYPVDEEGNLTLDANGNFGMVLYRTIEELQADGSIVLTGTQVSSSNAANMQDEMKNSQYVVELTFNEDGAKAFADATTKAYANGETIGIYYDGAFISVPNVNEPITGGQAQISGQSSFEEAEMLASNIRIGGLKLELEELRSNVVGAQLGSAAIKTSVIAAVIGLVIVILFMIVFYRIPGLASALALLIYTCITVFILSVFELTLTLPGIAGIILSIGMAVDANVIIFARIREELGTGKTVRSSIDIGFEKALSAIVDGNITTLIAAFVLAMKGTGSVKGFAQTLAIGIVISMFTALVITRLILKAFYAIGLQNEMLYGITKERKPFDFVSKKAIFFGISIVMVASGFVFMGINQANDGQILNFGLDFQGGTSTNVTFNDDYTIEQIDEQIVPIIEGITNDGNVQTQKVSGTNEVIIKTRTLDKDEREAFNQAMVENFQVNEKLIVAETISATVSHEMRNDAIIAVIIATICMLIYIWFRFKDIRFAASAVLALLHDVLVVLAFYAIAKVSVGSTFIACMLTIVGYSVNATIVIFDRIRENMADMSKKTDIKEVVNNSITQTLSRSINTSFTTFVMVAALFVLGVTSIKEFALPLMVGIVCGAYSSVCVTGPLWYVLKTKIKGKENK